MSHSVIGGLKLTTNQFRYLNIEYLLLALKMKRRRTEKRKERRKMEDK